MNDFWKRPLLEFVGLAAFGALVAAFSTPASGLSVVAVGLLAAWIRQLARVAALQHWLRDPASRAVPEGSGTWSEVWALLRRYERRSRADQDLLREALERSRQVGAALPDGVLILDGLDRIEWCNPALEKHFGISLARDRGQQITYLMRHPGFVEFVKAHRGAARVAIRNINNSETALDLSLVPFGADGQLIVSRDVTHEEKSERVRRDFVANVSHELRTPITVVSGFLETLADMEHPDMHLIARSISLMREQATRMERLVTDLLTLSKLESGQPLSADDEIDVGELARKLVREGEHLGRGQHRFALEISSEARIRGSESELHSALGNLVSNAVRYTRARGMVKLSWRVEDGHGVFTVADTGIGIAAEHLPRITERFYRVDRGRSRETGGTGLGLAIVKHVIQRHQAVLEVESEPGQGSRFSLRFPPERLVQAVETSQVALHYDVDNPE